MMPFQLARTTYSCRSAANRRSGSPGPRRPSRLPRWAVKSGAPPEALTKLEPRHPADPRFFFVTPRIEVVGPAATDPGSLAEPVLFPGQHPGRQVGLSGERSARPARARQHRLELRGFDRRGQVRHGILQTGIEQPFNIVSPVLEGQQGRRVSGNGAGLFTRTMDRRTRAPPRPWSAPPWRRLARRATGRTGSGPPRPGPLPYPPRSSPSRRPGGSRTPTPW